MGRVYKTAQGRQLDMEKLRLQNELVPAVGNMRVNARGDQLGAGGAILKTREAMLDEHYRAPGARSNKKNEPIPTGGKAKKVEAFAPAKIEADAQAGDEQTNMLAAESTGPAATPEPRKKGLAKVKK